MSIKRTEVGGTPALPDYSALLERSGWYAVSEPASPTWQGADTSRFSEAAKIADLRAEIEKRCDRLDEPYKSQARMAVASASATPAGLQAALAAVENISAAAGLVANADFTRIAQDAIAEAEREREALDKKWTLLKDQIDDELREKGVSEEDRRQLQETIEEHRDRAIELAQQGRLEEAKTEARSANSAVQAVGGSAESGAAVQENVEERAKNEYKLTIATDLERQKARPEQQAQLSSDVQAQAIALAPSSTPVSNAHEASNADAVQPLAQIQASNVTQEPSKPTSPSSGFGRR